MAYVHFVIQNDPNGKFHCELDGRDFINFRSGEYIKIDAGKHLLAFDGGSTTWNVQDVLNENDCMTIELMLGYEESALYKTVIGFPEYGIASLSDLEIMLVEKMIANMEEKQAAKSKETSDFVFKILRRVLALILTYGGLASVITGIGDETVILVILGVIMILVALRLFFVGKKKTKDKA